MRTTIIRLMSILGSVLLLLAVLIALLRFYPYTPNFPAYPRITHTKAGAEGDPLNLIFVGSQEQITRSFHQPGCLIPDPITPQTTQKITVAHLPLKSYPTPPASNLSSFA